MHPMRIEIIRLIHVNFAVVVENIQATTFKILCFIFAKIRVQNDDFVPSKNICILQL